ncbi:glycoside hydrolase family 30 protein [Opitutus terrae]|uniref:Glucosylceramidase n=1 Tax=Opitutus terrae (strain DSM 11246 / JCM 15787 / PB90-1) TaxID=452637 RepID=B1ZPN4_OPITP|nr:glycoside hydrolase family 30 protein [Opitutus terrae]ACB74553.1 Glucosylceramidase [Opitutus terrae PB90-1]
MFPRSSVLFHGAGLLVLTVSALAVTPMRSWSLIETARDNDHRLTAVALSTNAPAPGTDAPVLRADPNQRRQQMVGFGGALTESSAWVLAQLPAEKRLEVLRRYYDPQEGIGYTLARTHINSCDFSLSIWSLDETPGDYYLHDFTLAPMQRWLMPLLRDAYAIAGADRFKLTASPWSPPAWMKTNGRMDSGGALRPEYRDAWARFYVKFVEAMHREEKIPVWALTVQNEPEAVQVWESCIFSPEEERDFVRDHLGPTLQKAGLGDMRLIGFDHNRDIFEKRAAALFGDPASAQYLWGSAIHWYVSEDFAASSRVHAAFPQKQILFTEGCWEGGVKLGRWDRGERYARNMIGDFRNWVCGWIDWNIALDRTGGPNHVGNLCDAPVIVDTATGEVHYQSSFYYIAHFSRFVAPGAHCVESTTAAAGLDTVAFVNPDGSLVCVVLNATDTAQPFNLTTDGTALACEIPAHAIQTYVGRP